MNIIVYMVAVLAVTISVLLDAKVVAKQLAYKDVTMVVETRVAEDAPTVVHLVAVVCCTVVVALELDLDLPIKVNIRILWKRTSLSL